MNLSDIPMWAWGIGLSIVGAGFALIKWFAGSKVKEIDHKFETFRGLHRGHYEDDRARAIEIKELEIRILKDQLNEARKK